MPNTPSISDAEWQVMQILWQHEALTASEICDLLTPHHDWHPRTIKTMLARLVKKNALTYEVDRNRYIYRAAVSQDQCVRHATKSFLNRIFSGDPVSAMAHFVKTNNLSQAEIDELKKLLEDQS